MFKDTKAFSSFSINDVTAAKKFYSETLGLDVEETEQGLLLKITGTNGIFAYPKENHVPATYTVLNFAVDNIDRAVDELSGRGVQFERYENFEQDEKGIARGLSTDQGPDIAWFKDPAGNIIAVMQEEPERQP